MGTVSYLQSHRRCGAQIIVRGLNSAGEDVYRAAIVVPMHSSNTTLADLRGHSFAFGAPNSTQGHLIPRLMLQEAGLTLNDFRIFTFNDSHAATAKAVTSGRFDAGALQDTLAVKLAERKLVRILAFSECFVAKIGYIETQLPMDVVDQSSGDRLTPLQAALARTEGVTKRALDHQMHRFALPTLPKQAVQAGLSDAISPRAAFGVQ